MEYFVELSEDRLLSLSGRLNGEYNYYIEDGVFYFDDMDIFKFIIDMLLEEETSIELKGLGFIGEVVT